MSFENKIMRNIEKSHKQINKNGLPQPTESDMIDMVARVVEKTLPNQKIFQFDDCINYLKKQTKLEGKLLAKALDKSIGKNGIRAVTNQYGVFVQKMDP